MGCGCKKGSGGFRRRSISSKQVRNGVSYQQGLKTVSSQGTPATPANNQVSAQNTTNQKTVRRGLTKERREIERKRRLAIAKQKGK